MLSRLTSKPSPRNHGLESSSFESSFQNENDDHPSSPCRYIVNQSGGLDAEFIRKQKGGLADCNPRKENIRKDTGTHPLSLRSNVRPIADTHKTSK